MRWTDPHAVCLDDVDRTALMSVQRETYDEKLHIRAVEDWVPFASSLFFRLDPPGLLGSVLALGKLGLVISGLAGLAVFLSYGRVAGIPGLLGLLIPPPP